jgi:hypothetical protein
VVPAVKPVSVLENDPEPAPEFTVKVDAPELVPYTKPRAVTCVVPSSVTFPATTAEVVPTEEAGVVAAKTGVVDGDAVDANV